MEFKYIAVQKKDFKYILYGWKKIHLIFCIVFITKEGLKETKRIMWILLLYCEETSVYLPQTNLFTWLRLVGYVRRAHQASPADQQTGP